MSSSLPIKFLKALTGMTRTFRATPEPRLVMTLLVKNEEMMLEENLRFHKAMGVDAFIVTDNNSTDRTPGILQEYQRRGWIAEIINETDTDYEQKTWVDRMIVLARDKYGADWVINADADELWYAPGGSLKEELRSTHANVLNCRLHSVYPEEERPFTEWNRTVSAVADPAPYGLSLYSLFERQNPKVIHRTAGYVQISMGNHKVAMFPKRTAESGVRIYHYNVRGRKAFLEKMINGGRQLEQHKGRHGGRHWRYFYRLYKEGRLDEEYDRVIGTKAYEALMRDGYIATDNTIPEFFRTLNGESK